MGRDKNILFLQSGGTLLKIAKNIQGQYFIMEKKFGTDWRFRMAATSKDSAMKIVNALCQNHPEEFKMEK